MSNVFVLTSDNAARAGGKGTRLAWLADQGVKVPATIVVSAGDYAAGSLDVRIDPQATYIVRSSADLEDSGQASFAGQFASILNVKGSAAMHTAVAQVRASMDVQDAGAMQVLIQPQIDAKVAGVMFTRNPLTGLDERIVEAARGSSEAILAGGAEPERWVWRWGNYTERPEATLIEQKIIDSVVAEGNKIAEALGEPVDLEWVFDGTDLWWVQLRPITALDVAVYSSRISREVLPGAIKPLVWSINIPLVNGQWIALFDEAIGPTGLRPDDLARQFGHFAYFNMGAIGEIFVQVGMPRDALENLLGLPGGDESPPMKPSSRTMLLLPRLLRFAWKNMRARQWSEGVLADTVDLYASHRRRDLATVDLGDYCSQLDRKLAPITRANVVVPLVMNLWNGLLSRLIPDGAIQNLELPAPDRQRLADLSPNAALDRIAGAVTDEQRRAAIAQCLFDFGHLSESGNDLSVPTWAERPDLVERFAEQTRSPSAATLSIADAILGLPTWKKPLAKWVARQAAYYRVQREAISSAYTKLYGLYRPLALEAGRRLVEADVIDEVDDVFYLARDEAFGEPRDRRSAVQSRRDELAASADLELPEVIFGTDYTPRLRRPPTAKVLKGTGTSRGRYTGPARVARTTDDILKVRPGDVLIVPFSDVGWTPLFASVGAVVSESGGLLSHSSIIARERGVPAVVSVLNACSIEDGTILTVDGDAGDVLIDSLKP